MLRLRPSAALFALLLVSASPAWSALSAVREATGLTRPVYGTTPPGDTHRLFVLEQPGRIRIIKDGTLLATPFLDITSIVQDAGNEQGLLGLAFSPDYATTGYFYVYFTYHPPGGTLDQSRVMRFKVSMLPDIADGGSGRDVFRTDQPYSNHNGGQLAFGPDGYLYLGLGDGGSAGDPNNNAQNGLSLLGKMLRFDPTGDDFPADSTNNYTIPPTNPFVGDASFRDEIWAYGLRNPYRWSFDRGTGDMYIGDVGQNVWEEIDFQPASSTGGENYGWRCWEGNHAYNQTPPCPGPIVFPIFEYNHSTDGFSCAVTGGYVYRGAADPSLQGTYFYADYCSGHIHTFRYVGGVVTDPMDRTAELTPDIGAINSPVGFAEDANGELHIMDLDGDVFRIVATATDAPSPERPARFGLSAPAPNPFSGETLLSLHLAGMQPITVSVYDAAGRLVRRLLHGTYSAGEVPVRWNGRDQAGRPVPGGVYFVRATTPDAVGTRRVVRLR